MGDTRRAESRTAVVTIINQSLLQYFDVEKKIPSSDNDDDEAEDERTLRLIMDPTESLREILRNGREERGFSNLGTEQIEDRLSALGTLLDSLERLLFQSDPKEIFKPQSESEKLQTILKRHQNNISISSSGYDWSKKRDVNNSNEVEEEEEEEEEFIISLIPSALIIILHRIYNDRLTDSFISQAHIQPMLEYSEHMWWKELIEPSLNTYPYLITQPARKALGELLNQEIDRSIITSEDDLDRKGFSRCEILHNLFESYKLNYHQRFEIIKKFDFFEPNLAKSILLNWGKKNPKMMFRYLEQLIFNTDELERFDQDILFGLSLLIEFMSCSPYSIHHLQNNTIPIQLINSIITNPFNKNDLQYQQKTIRQFQIHLRLMINSCLIILPRLPNLFVQYLPFVFICFSKICCLDEEEEITGGESNPEERKEEEMEVNEDPDKNIKRQKWLSSSLDSKLDFFNLLYGLCPSNFIEFLRNPIEAIERLQRTIKEEQGAGKPQENEPRLELNTRSIDIERLKRLPVINKHRLTPDLALTSPANELKEIKNRLKLFESAELIEKYEKTLIIEANDRIEMIERPRVVGIKEAENLIKMENMVLKNKLWFEFYLKQQHLQQMGSLHKSNILGSALEAENQNLHTINKELRKKLEKKEEEEMIMKPNSNKNTDNDKEGTKNKISNTLKSKHEIFLKRKDYLESIKSKRFEYRQQIYNLNNELNAQSELSKSLNELVIFKNEESNSAQAEAHKLKNELELLKPKLDIINQLEEKNETLTKALLTWDDDLRRFRESRKQIDKLTNEWKKSESIANSMVDENTKLRIELKSQIEKNVELNTENNLLKQNHLNNNQYHINRLRINEEQSDEISNQNMNRNNLYEHLNQIIQNLKNERNSLKIQLEELKEITIGLG